MTKITTDLDENTHHELVIETAYLKLTLSKTAALAIKEYLRQNRLKRVANSSTESIRATQKTLSDSSNGPAGSKAVADI